MTLNVDSKGSHASPASYRRKTKQGCARVAMHARVGREMPEQDAWLDLSALRALCVLQGGPAASSLRSQWPRGAPRALILGPACSATQKPPALTANRECDREAPDQEGPRRASPWGRNRLKRAFTPILTPVMVFGAHGRHNHLRVGFRGTKAQSTWCNSQVNQEFSCQKERLAKIRG
jgi:hypothetical protein